MKIPSIALVGRPNVGKSTIFNRIIGKKISIIEDTPGVTRDRIYGVADHKNIKFSLIDTGGIDVGNELFNQEIKIQAEIAIDEADTVIFVVDGKEGLTQNDYEVRDILFKSKKKVIVAINKVDNKKTKENLYDFYELGFEHYIPISGEHGTNFDKLLDEATKGFEKQFDEEENILKFCLIGRPNVGKSSLVNALLNEERVIVSNEAGTTRDSIDTRFRYDHEDYIAIDTAGLRKKGKIYENVEKYSALRAMKSIERSNVCVLVINAEEGIIEQDKHIASYALDAGKPLVLVVNKWDTVEDKNDIKSFTEKMRAEFQFLSYVPIVFLSALTKKRLHTLMPEILKVSENINRQIPTNVINDVINDAYMLNIPPSYKGKRLKIYFTNQSGTKPPKFTFHVNDKHLVHFSYERYLENKLRENFELEGTPIILQFKNRGE